MLYLDPKNDLTFKKIFGEHPNLLMSFLNSLLPLEDDELIVSIEYLSPEMVPDIPLFKDSMVDVRCFDKKGRNFIVEMQMLWTDSFKSRVLFNVAKAYVRQLEKGEKYKALQPVYALSIVNENFESSANFYHHYKIVCTENDNKQLKGLEFIFVELLKFKPENMVSKRLNILWLRFLKEMKDKKRGIDIPQEFLNEPEIKQAIECLEESSFSPPQLDYYDRYWDFVSREKSLRGDGEEKILAAEKIGREEGEKVGLEKGEKVGLEKAKIIGIQKALERGKLSVEEIAEDFDVSIEFVLNIKS
jgi:predicted transposase/invertase (TIGR01784 family)